MLDQGKWFYLAGGKSAQSIEELAQVLKEVPDNEFVFHVNGAKNDFANWVEGVFEERDLADELRHVMERKDTVRVLEQYLHRNKAGGKEDKSVLEHEAPKFAPDTGDMEVREHEQEVSVEEPVIKVEGEKDLSQDDLKEIVEETKQELEIEGRHVDEDTHNSVADKISRATGFSKLDDRTRFIIKEFIFGFVLGLIFGLIMLGALMNIKCY